jgi:CRISPR-associated endonuclease/helicase Cas3/CRISPR-associated endonuclease Cas3-HD
MMSFEQYISHPAETDDGEPTLLISDDGTSDEEGHLEVVARRMSEACRGQSLKTGDSAETAAKIIGLTHDFTKLSTWAQKHLRGQSFQQPERYRYHSFSSSLITLYCSDECFEEIGPSTTEIATMTVAQHHNTAAPPDPTDIAEKYGQVTNQVKARYDRVDEQFDDIDGHAAERADHIIDAATSGRGSWDGFRRWHEQMRDSTDGVHEYLLYFDKFREGPDRQDYYEDVLTLWTALKFADQTAACGLRDSELNSVLPNRADLEEHIEQLDDGDGILARLNELRNRAREAATERVTDIVDSGSVGLITLPTGFGKTYAGLSAGLRAAELSESRFVYVLPYTSILDQTAREIQSVFGVSPYSESFTLHHHLADTYTGLDDHHTDRDIGRSPGALHAESWRSGLTLTTTVQLFESLTAPTARQATRIPSLQDSVIVIDEPQAIPDDWWQIVPRLVEILVGTYDATVILMTATQPGIIKYGSDALNTQDLIDDTELYTSFLAEHPRVVYRLHPTIENGGEDAIQTVDYSDAGSAILNTADGRDVLSICNTRASAQALYKHVIEARDSEADPVELGPLLHGHVENFGELPTVAELRSAALNELRKRDTDTVYAFLSGDVRPDDRSLIIDALYTNKREDSNRPGPLLDDDCSVVLVSTSVVEAGVDISFDAVYRDYAPIPNIVQAGGRCNRSFGGGTGDVTIWQLGETEDASGIPSLIIHGGDGGDALPLLQVTGRVLRRHSTEGAIDETTMVSETVSDFYTELFKGPFEPGDETLSSAVDTNSISVLEGQRMINEIEAYDDVIACLTDGERQDILGGEMEMEIISTHAGAQVSTNPEGRHQEVTIGNSKYVVLDAGDGAYHPVFGVQ